MLQPKPRGPCWFGDQLRSRSSSLSWRLPRPRSSWWRERLSWLLSTLSACRQASMVFRASRLGSRRHLTTDAVAATPSPRPWCWEGSGFGPWADGAAARPRSERWCEAELSVCCSAAASNSAFSCWRTRRCSEVEAPGSHAAAWPQRQGSETPGGKVAERQLRHSRRRSRLRWRVGCCRAPTHAPTVAGLQPVGTRAGCHCPHGAPPAQEHPAPSVDRRSLLGLAPAQARPVQVVNRGARHPC
jgi:hypothetical protein